MPSRRQFLRATGVGLAASLAGCIGLPVGSTSDAATDPVQAFLADASFETLFDAPFDGQASVNATLQYYDVEAIRPARDDYPGLAPLWGIDDAFYLEGAAGDAWREQLSTYLSVHYVTSVQPDQDDAWHVTGHANYADGSFDAGEYYAASSLEVSDPESYREYDLHLDAEGPLLGVGDGGLVGSWAGGYSHLEDGESVVEERPNVEATLVRDAVDRVEDLPAPADWVDEGLSRARPFHLARVNLVPAPDGRRSVAVGAHELRGDESTYRVAYAAPTADEFQRTWDEETLRTRVSWPDDAEPTLEVGETAGHAEVTASTRPGWVG